MILAIHHKNVNLCFFFFVLLLFFLKDYLCNFFISQDDSCFCIIYCSIVDKCTEGLNSYLLKSMPEHLQEINKWANMQLPGSECSQAFLLQHTDESKMHFFSKLHSRLSVPESYIKQLPSVCLGPKKLRDNGVAFQWVMFSVCCTLSESNLCISLENTLHLRKWREIKIHILKYKSKINSINLCSDLCNLSPPLIDFVMCSIPMIFYVSGHCLKVLIP